MNRWEYRKVTMNNLTKFVACDNGGDLLDKDGEYWGVMWTDDVAILDHCGREGWELCNVTGSGHCTHFYLKRRIGDWEIDSKFISLEWAQITG